MAARYTGSAEPADPLSTETALALLGAGAGADSTNPLTPESTNLGGQSTKAGSESDNHGGLAEDLRAAACGGRPDTLPASTCGRSSMRADLVWAFPTSPTIHSRRT